MISVFPSRAGPVKVDSSNFSLLLEALFLSDNEQRRFIVRRSRKGRKSMDTNSFSREIQILLKSQE